jgi:hypothetical protein
MTSSVEGDKGVFLESGGKDESAFLESVKTISLAEKLSRAEAGLSNEKTIRQSSEEDVIQEHSDVVGGNTDKNNPQKGSQSPLPNHIDDDYETYLKGGKIELDTSSLVNTESIEQNEAAADSDESSESVHMDEELKSSWRQSRNPIPDQSSHSVTFFDVEDVRVFPLEETDDSDEKGDFSFSSFIETKSHRSQRSGLRHEKHGLNVDGALLEDNPQRISKRIDLETGREGARTQFAVVRSQSPSWGGKLSLMSCSLINKMWTVLFFLSRFVMPTNGIRRYVGVDCRNEQKRR